MAKKEGKSVSYDGKSFIINGKRVFIYSGEMHYFRIPPSQWHDRLLKAKRAFLNCIGTYMAWNWHEQREGEFCFEGDRDLEKWMELIEDSGLYIIARPGPYICAEWDFGGFPNWLIPKDCEMRSLEPNFIKYSSKWLNKVDTIIKPHLITKSGKVFIYQVENEFEVGNLPYHLKLKEIAEKDGINVAIVTNVNARLRGSEIIEMPDPYLRGSWDISEPMGKIRDLRKSQPDKPPFGMEVACAAFSRFGEPLPFTKGGYTPPEKDEVYLKSLIAAGISGFNYYMYHGGTNLGYWTGRGITTTYDRDAPIREWGELNERYYIMRRLGGFLECFGEKLLEAVPMENYCRVSHRDVKVFVRKSKESAFIFLANLYSKDIDFKIFLEHPKTRQQLSFPYRGNYRLAEYSMSILPINIKLSDDLTLFYSTSQIFYFIDNDEERILILYEKPNFEGELVLELKDKKVRVSGEVKYEWIKDKRLLLNYTHTEEPKFILIRGEKLIRLIITTTSQAAHAWLVNYKEKTLPIISNIYFLRGWKEKEKKLILHSEIKEGELMKARIPALSSPQGIKVNGEEVKFSYDEDKEVIKLNLAKQEMPQVYFDLSGKWKIKEDSSESEYEYEDGGWRDWKPWEPLENYGFLKNGYSWHRTSFEVSKKDKPLHLILTGFQDEASVYLNGQYIGSGINSFKKDVSQYIKLGKNKLAILLEAVGHSCEGYKTFNGITHPIYLSSEEKFIKLRDWKRKSVSNKTYKEKELLKELQPEVSSDFNDSDWEKVVVDWNWDSRLSKSGDEVRFCWYRTEVEVPSGFAGMSLSLDFAEMKEDAYIYINEKFLKVERNTGLNLPFSIDVTRQIKIGEKNNIVIGVKAGRWCPLFGLHKSVKLSLRSQCLDKNWKICEGLSGQREGWYEASCDDSTWDEVDVPVKEEIGRCGGIVWYRRKVKLETPEGYLAPLRLALKDTTSKALIYFNGVLIGRYADVGPQEDFYIYEDLVKKENIITIAVEGKKKNPKLGKVSISPYYMVKKVDVELSQIR